MPAGVVTVTSTVPVPAGLSAVIVVSLTTVEIRRRRRAEVDRGGAGETGAGDRHQSAAGGRTARRAQARDRGRRGTVYVNSSAGETADVPAGVVTVTFTTPVPAGLSAVIVVSLTTSRFVAAVVPKSTAVAPVKLVPRDRHRSAAGLDTASRRQARDRWRRE